MYSVHCTVYISSESELADLKKKVNHRGYPAEKLKSTNGGRRRREGADSAPGRTSHVHCVHIASRDLVAFGSIPYSDTLLVSYSLGY